ncbi:MAG: tRNA (N6-threonylcarbamoyladenosine(37)-N6)-methyltransferase TrmO [Eubacteriales bacterium]
MRPIAFVRSDFHSKFGIPRQAGLVAELKSTVVFEPEFQNPDALRGLEDFSHIWLIWEFSQNRDAQWSPTVRPPRLGGNVRMGVFATRSPFRPNPIGLSCVKLAGLEQTKDHGTVLHILGADLMDGTPIFDIKPYVPYADCHPDALGGFASTPTVPTLEVTIPSDLLAVLKPAHRDGLIAVLSHDPRPSYQRDPARIYGLDFADYNVKFQVNDPILTVVSIVSL